MWYITVHWLCMSCSQMKRTHMDAMGRIHQGGRVYPEDWVKHSLEGNGRANQRMAFIKTLDPTLIARKSNGRKK